MKGYIKLKKAALCMDCEAIFDFGDNKQCPRCARQNCMQVRTWIPSLKDEDLELTYEPRIEVPTLWSIISRYFRHALCSMLFAFCLSTHIAVIQQDLPSQL